MITQELANIIMEVHLAKNNEIGQFEEIGEKQQNILNLIHALQIREIATQDYQILFYEIKSIKSITNNQQNQLQETMKKLSELGIKSLTELYALEDRHLQYCNLPELTKSTSNQFFLINQELLSFLFTKFRMQFEHICSILRKMKIRTIDEFFSQNDDFLLPEIDNLVFEFHKPPYYKKENNSLQQKKSNNFTNKNENISQCNQNSLEDQIFLDVLHLPETRYLKQMDGFILYEYPKINQPLDLSGYKTILFIGEKRAGKTSLINFLLNYQLEVQQHFKFRYVLPQISNQDFINTYYIKPHNNKCGLRIIDTPGFGEGQNNQKTLEIIKDKLLNEIDQITMVCCVLSSGTPRLNIQKTYAVDYMVQLFGFNFVRNFIFGFTFNDDSTPPAIESLQFEGDKDQPASPVAQFIKFIPHPWHLEFSNSCLFKINLSELNKSYWINNYQSFEKFFSERLSKVETLSFKRFQHINNTQQKSIDELYYVICELHGQIEQYNAYKLPQEIMITKSQVANKLQSINCPKCLKTCYYNSSDIETIQSCERNEFCCCGCLFQEHKYENFIYDIKIQKETNKNQKNFSLENFYKLLEMSFKLLQKLAFLYQIKLTSPESFKNFLTFLKEDKLKVQIPGSHQRIEFLQDLNQTLFLFQKKEKKEKVIEQIKTYLNKNNKQK